MQGWDYLIAELWLILALAIILGAVVGWFARGGAGGSAAELEELRELLKMRKARIAMLEDDLRAMKLAQTDYAAPVVTSGSLSVVSQRPPSLAAPLDDAPDDLTRIDGVDDRIAGVLENAGIFHFSQIAAWTEAECAWVATRTEADPMLEDWMGQARILLRQDVSGRTPPATGI